MIDDRLLSESQAIAYLGISRPTLRKYRLAGLLPFVATPGGRYRYRESDLRAWCYVPAREDMVQRADPAAEQVPA